MLLLWRSCWTDRQSLAWPAGQPYDGGVNDIDLVVVSKYFSATINGVPNLRIAYKLSLIWRYLDDESSINEHFRQPSPPPARRWWCGNNSTAATAAERGDERASRLAGAGKVVNIMIIIGKSKTWNEPQLQRIFFEI